jgi:branched-chain amino acid aminotransferase
MKYISYTQEGFTPTEEVSFNFSKNYLSIVRGYQVFTFFRTMNMKPIFLDDHLDRIFSNALSMHMEVPFSKEELKQKVFQTLEHNKSSLNELNIMILFAGTTALKYSPLSTDQPIDLYIIISPIKEYSQEYLSGVSLGLFEYARNMGEVKAPFTYFGGILGEHQLVKTKKYDEILFTDQGLILEGSTFSFFAVKGTKIITPPTDGKILESVTRKNVIQSCLDGFEFEERPILVEEISSFDEAFITSANRGVVPVLKIDGSLISSSVGSVTSSIKERYWSLIS